jgi:dihydroflavonol-4-reductase
MTVVVTGASGHVGAALVRELLASGASVRALVHSDTRPLEGLRADVRRVDVTDAAAVRDALTGAEVVYHAAARVTLASSDDGVADAVNVQGTRNVVEACVRQGVGRLVHFSTAHALVEGGQDLRAHDTGHPYERTKAEAEREVARAIERGLDAVIVSPAAVVGPFDHKPSHIGRFLLLVARGWVPMAAEGGQSWVDVRDVARSAVAAARSGETGARYVLAGHWLTMLELATRASRVAGVSPPRGSVPRAALRRVVPVFERAAAWIGSEPLFTRASVEALEARPRPNDDRAASHLGHAPRPVDTTLSDTFAWFRDAGLWTPRGRR